MADIKAHLDSTSAELHPSTYSTRRDTDFSLKVIIPSGWSPPQVTLPKGMEVKSQSQDDATYTYTIHVGASARSGTLLVRSSSLEEHSTSKAPQAEKTGSGTIDVSGGGDPEEDS